MSDVMLANDAKWASRKVVFSGAVSAVVLLVGAIGLYASQAYYRMVLDKPPAPLSKPLHELSSTLGTRFVQPAGESDKSLPEGIVESLGTKDYLLRTYQDNGEHPAGQGPWRVALNLNYYATGDASPHVPENCWVGNGRQPPELMPVVVKGVKRKDGTTVDITMKLLSFLPTKEELRQMGAVGAVDTGEMKTDLRRNVAYVFHVNGVYESNPVAVVSRFWNATNKFAYHAKIEMTMEQLCTPEQAQVELSDFLRESLADIEECLPDPKILTEGVAAKGSATEPAERK